MALASGEPSGARPPAATGGGGRIRGFPRGTPLWFPPECERIAEIVTRGAQNVAKGARERRGVAQHEEDGPCSTAS